MSNSKSFDAVNRVNNERLEDLIHEALVSKMSKPDCKFQFQEFDVEIRKEIGRPVFADVNVFGMAGDTTKDDMVTNEKDGLVKVMDGAGSFAITLDDGTVAKFVFDSASNLNATDYMMTYRLA